MKKQLLITGAFGLVGSNICKVLERDYPDIEITKVKFDLDDDGKDFKVMQSSYYPFDYIIHASGYGQPILFSKEKLKTIEVNTKTTDELFKWLIPKGKFLFVSSSEVYSGAHSPHKETDIGNTTPQHPRACYIEGKRCGEAICMAYKEQGYDVKIARLALAYGPGTKKGDTRVLNQFIEQALTNKTIHMKDGGYAVRTYCYVDDAVNQLLNILFNGTSTVYNVGGMSKTSIRDLACKIADLTGSRVVLGHDGFKDAPEDVRLDMFKTVNEFGGEFIPLEEGLKRTIEYQKQLYK